jgi:hypothetical protein
LDNPALRALLADQLREWVTQRYLEHYADQPQNLLVDVSVVRRSDYYEVMIFLSDSSLVAEAKEFSRGLEEELAVQGVNTLFYVRTWTGPWQGGGRQS